ncbi:MAG: UDP-3-O-(3-hydroxymyristoyl)glucosamine N-acyltransferase [Armatimonadota bacterium]
MQISLQKLADFIDGEIIGDPDTLIIGAADISDAHEGDVVFAESPKLLEAAVESGASVIITRTELPHIDTPRINVANPRLAFAKALEAFSPVRYKENGIHPSCFIGEETVIGENPSIGYNAFVGRNVVIGNNVWIHPLAYISENVRIGDNSVIHPFVTIYDSVTIGSDVTIHSGTVIGADGFGYTRVGAQHYKIPQIGEVVIGDRVEIGANVTIDRARTGKTSIGCGTKIDNLVHVAHNVTIGENCIVIAQVGISGSVTVGDRVLLTGQAGIADHVVIGNDAIICGRAGVIGDIEQGSFVSGYPARPHREQMRMHAAQKKLPNLLRTVKELEKRIKELEDRTD